MSKKVESRLIQRQSQFPMVCIYCNKSIAPNEIHYLEVGVTEHIHSLIARKFCEDCYTKHGERFLLRGIQT